MKITKNDLVNKLASKCRMTKKLSHDIITILFDIIMEDLANGDFVILPTIGTLRPIFHKAMIKKNIHTQGNDIVPAKLRIKLLQSLKLVDKMKKLYASELMQNVTLYK